MTEQEWLECTEPERMVSFLRNQISECTDSRKSIRLREGMFSRKLLLFALSCSYCLWHTLNKESKNLVNLASKYLNHHATESELSQSFSLAWQSWLQVLNEKKDVKQFQRGLTLWLPALDGIRGVMSIDQAIKEACFAEVQCAKDNFSWTDDSIWHDQYNKLRQMQAGVQHHQSERLRDIFGNPFRPVAVDPLWRTPSVTAIAQTIYDERRFADMPILADALEEAGCTSADMLDHCRQPGEHVRGCWVVDLILEKA